MFLPLSQTLFVSRLEAALKKFLVVVFNQSKFQVNLIAVFFILASDTKILSYLRMYPCLLHIDWQRPRLSVCLSKTGTNSSEQWTKPRSDTYRYKCIYTCLTLVFSCVLFSYLSDTDTWTITLRMRISIPINQFEGFFSMP